jgi:peptidoglycan/xylan/chitin deacetylase (PgdA/CDA1 family)
VPEAKYRQQINLIQSRGRLVTSEELVGLRTRDDLQHLARSSSSNMYLFTFDDGYVEHPRAAEILAEAGGAGIFFVTSETLRGRMLLANKLHLLELHMGSLDSTIRAIERAAEKPLRRYLIDVGHALLANVQKAGFDTLDDQALKVALQEMETDDILTSAIDRVIAALIPAGATDDLYADDAGLQHIVACGSLIGGHGKTHRRLPLLNNALKIAEVEASAALVRRFHASGPWHFAHPYGTYDATSIEMIVAAGFDFLHTIMSGSIGSDGVDPHCLPRIDVKSLYDIL